MTQEERNLLLRKFDEMPNNQPMELKEIFGEIDWNSITSKTNFGKDVKNLVISHQIPEIQHVNIKRDNHNTYIKQIRN
jgi:hypothetical protein